MDQNLHRIAEQLVDRNVHALASQMVAFVHSFTSDLPDDEGGLASLMGRDQDAEEAVRDYLADEKDPHTLMEWADELFVSVEEEDTFDDPDAWADHIRAGVVSNLERCGGWEHMCFVMEVWRARWEVLEHWVVSPWLAERLMERGEVVAQPWEAMWIWGRTNSGQAIAMDGVIVAIAEEFTNA